MPEPSAGARRAAERILKCPWAYEFDGERKVSKLAQIIDSETRCGEMRKALEDAQGMIGFLCCCIHSGESLSAEDEGTVDNVIKAIKRALGGEKGR